MFPVSLIMFTALGTMEDGTLGSDRAAKVIFLTGSSLHARAHTALAVSPHPASPLSSSH